MAKLTPRPDFAGRIKRLLAALNVEPARAPFVKIKGGLVALVEQAESIDSTVDAVFEERDRVKDENARLVELNAKLVAENAELIRAHAAEIAQMARSYAHLERETAKPSAEETAILRVLESVDDDYMELADIVRAIPEGLPRDPKRVHAVLTKLRQAEAVREGAGARFMLRDKGRELLHPDV